MQQAAEVDLDRLVDYKTEYCSVIKKHKITGCLLYTSDAADEL